ncbi:DUF2007 domain-containing protein [Roseateles sp. UC29_93]|uniref:putative signal transducing protein n=1 Tax=Roseateles sp. UC29_93 TaxID=3350177 RepID=UPI00366B9D49
MPEHNEPTSDDFVCVATRTTPTEAHLLRGVLEAAGLTPHVADDQMVQSYSLIAHAVGGVRVLVPGSQAPAAREAIAEFDAGAFQLEGEESAAPATIPLTVPLFSPDRAVLLGFLLTPAFGAGIQLANARAIRDGRLSADAWLSFILLSALSLVGIYALHENADGPFVVFEASLLLCAVNVIWYVIAGQKQSRALIKTYGSHYPKKRLLVPAVAAAIAALALGAVLQTLR